MAIDFAREPWFAFGLGGVAIGLVIGFGTGYVNGGWRGYDNGWYDATHEASLPLDPQSEEAGIERANKDLLVGSMAYVFRTIDKPQCTAIAESAGIFIEPDPTPNDSIEALIHVMPIDRGNGPWDVEVVKNDPTVFHLVLVTSNGQPALGAIRFEEKGLH